ncbi:MAG: hypothetical protein NTY70_11855 [Burkholderiales bacterium]|nr:hypothetical protein [Burkholderiales bacterium]
MIHQKILLCMGTRPEIIKMAPIYHELKACNIETLLLHTGQHQDMADPMYGFFKIVPDFSLHLPRTSDKLFHLWCMAILRAPRWLLWQRFISKFQSVMLRLVCVHIKITIPSLKKKIEK